MILSFDVVFSALFALLAAIFMCLGIYLLVQVMTRRSEEFPSEAIEGLGFLGSALCLLAAALLVVGFAFAPQDLFLHDLALLSILTAALAVGRWLAISVIRRRVQNALQEPESTEGETPPI